MAGSFSRVDLSQLLPPDAVQALDFETIFAEMLADLQARAPQFTALVESDPAYAILEVAAFRELLIRQDMNDTARALLVAYARGADLDQIGANYGVARLLITPADDTTIPPTAAVYEADDDFRVRIVLSLESYTTAGSAGSYVFHALSASGDVKDVSVTSPAPGEVNVYVLSREGNGAAGSDLIEAVDTALNADTVRPLTDHVTVLSAAIVNYQIAGVLTVFPGPDAGLILAIAQATAADYAAGQHRNGHDITLSGIYAALHQAGVQNVALTLPAADIVIAEHQAPFCTSITVTAAGAPDV